VYADVHNICLTYTPAHAWCSTTPMNACRLSAKMHMDSYIYIHIYIYTCTHVHIHTHTCIHIYIYTYTYKYTYIYTWIHIHIHTHIYVHIYVYIYIFICTYIYIYLYIYRICTSCIEREANVYTDVHNICLMYISAHAWCSTTPVNACRLSAKMHMDSCMCTCANCAAASLSWKLLRTYLESCANIVQAVVYHPPSYRSRAGPPSSARPPSCRPPAARCSTLLASKNSSKSTLAHDAVAAAVLHKHHPIICVGVGLIQFVYGSRSHLANGSYPSQKCVFAIFARVWVTINRLIAKTKQAAIAALMSSGIQAEERWWHEAEFSIHRQQS